MCITYSESYCEDTMREVIEGGHTDGTIFDIKGTGILEEWRLEYAEEDLLMKYSSLLFDTMPSNYNQREIMQKFVGICAYHFIAKREKAKLLEKTKQLSYKKETDKKRVPALKSQAERILNIIGTESNYIHVKKLIGELDKLLNNTESYLPKNLPSNLLHPEISAQIPKKHVKKFLLGLKLKNKTKNIEEFLKEI